MNRRDDATARDPESPLPDLDDRSRPAASRRELIGVLVAGVLTGGAAGALGGAVAGGRTTGREEGARSTGDPSGTSTSPPPNATAASGLVADGVTDNAALLNDLFDSAGDGAAIRLPAGVLLVAGRLRLRSGLTLTGADGRGTTIRLQDGAGSPFVLLKQLTDVTVRGLRFDGGQQNPGEIALQIDGSTGVLVEDCAFVRMSHAVHAYGSDGAAGADVTVRRNSFSSISDFAIRISSGCTGVTIRENTVHDVQKVAAPSPAAVLVEGAEVSVIGNVVTSSADTGVMVAGTSALNVSVTDNVLATTLVGVFAGSGARVVGIKGNRISSQRDFGIHLYDEGGRALEAVVTGNQIVTSGKSGVQVEGVSAVSVSANAISDVGTRSDAKASWRGGVVVTATSGGAPERVTLSDNVVTSSSDDSIMANGILIESAGRDLHVQGNAIEGSTDAPVSVARGLPVPYYVETTTRVYTSRETDTL